MSIEKVKEYFAEYGREDDILEFDQSSATVELAAQAANVIPARIAKTLSFKNKAGENAILIVVAGDAKIDNKKYKAEFATKAKMLKNIKKIPPSSDTASLIDVLFLSGDFKSKNELHRLFKQNSVKSLSGEILKQGCIDFKGEVIKIGKRRYYKIE